MEFQDGEILMVVKCDEQPELVGNTFVYRDDYNNHKITVLNAVSIYDDMVEKVEIKQGDEVEVSDGSSWTDGYIFITKYNGYFIVKDVTGVIASYSYCRSVSKTCEICFMEDGIVRRISEKDYNMLAERYKVGTGI